MSFTHLAHQNINILDEALIGARLPAHLSSCELDSWIAGTPPNAMIGVIPKIIHPPFVWRDHWPCPVGLPYRWTDHSVAPLDTVCLCFPTIDYRWDTWVTNPLQLETPFPFEVKVERRVHRNEWERKVAEITSRHCKWVELIHHFFPVLSWLVPEATLIRLK